MAQRALEPGSKLAATRWIAERIAAGGCPGFSEDAAYAAMDFLLAALDDIAGEIFGSVAHRAQARRQGGHWSQRVRAGEVRPAPGSRQPGAESLAQREDHPVGSEGEATPVTAGRPAAALGRLPAAQQTVLALMAGGLHDNAIARRAHLSTATVRRHIASIMNRLDVTSRFAVGAAAQRRGWIG